MLGEVDQQVVAPRAQLPQQRAIPRATCVTTPRFFQLRSIVCTRAIAGWPASIGAVSR